MPSHFDHIRWRRLSPTTARVLRQNRAGVRFPPRSQPQIHGQKLLTEMDQSLQNIRSSREEVGIDPNNLLKTLEIAVIKHGKIRSPSLMIRAQAKKKAK